MGTARFLLIGIVLVFAPLIGCSADRGLSTGQHHFFQKYKTKPHYRALSFTGSLPRAGSMSGASFSASSVEKAIEGALQRCEKGKKENVWETPIGDCELFAIGDIVVHGMSDDELESAMALYRTNPYADNDELDALVLNNPLNGSANLLSEAEIRAKIIGNTMTGFSTRQGVQWTELYLQDGTIKGVYDGERGTAEWYLSGSEMCWDYEGTKYDGCWPLALNGREVVFYEDEKAGGRAQVLQGNPKGL